MEKKKVVKLGNSCYVIVDKVAQVVSGIKRNDLVKLDYEKDKIIITKIKEDN